MIRILDKDLRFVDFLRKYTFSRFTERFRGIGDFQIDVVLLDENKFLLNKEQQFFVLFDTNYFGVIENIHKNSDSENEKILTISGKMAAEIFNKRIVYQTIKFNGKTKDFVKTVISDNMINSNDNDRNMNIVLSEKKETFTQNRCKTINKSVTGNTVWEGIEPILELDRLGLFVRPHIYIEGQERGRSVVPNIDRWDVIISGGVDRTKGNPYNNIPVIFSQSFSNIQTTEYIKEDAAYCNVAYIAGEGEGAARKWYKKEINQGDSKGLVGWNRDELWIDARDIQSTDEEGNTITEEEYEALINKRISEKAEEAKITEIYEATVIISNKMYVFGKDYNLGDFVTIIDDELGITIDTQIVEVTVSEQDSETIVDIGLSYGSIERGIIEDARAAKRLSNENAINIKYLENKIKTLGSGSGGGGGSEGVGLFAFEIRDGDLILKYQDGTTPPVFEIRDGYLYVNV